MTIVVAARVAARVAVVGAAMVAGMAAVAVAAAAAVEVVVGVAVVDGGSVPAPGILQEDSRAPGLVLDHGQGPCGLSLGAFAEHMGA